jgi:AraC family transcriptional regulator
MEVNRVHPKIQQIPIPTASFSPKVLKSTLFTQGLNYPIGYKLGARFVYDYELEYFISSSGSMLIEDTIYPITKESIVFRKPGQLTEGIMPYCCYLICFDLTGQTPKDPKTYNFEQTQDFQHYYQNSIIEAIPAVFQTQYGDRYQYLFDSVLKEFVNPSEGSELILKSYVLQILYQLYQDVTNPFAHENVPLSPHYITIKKVVQYIQTNYPQKMNLNPLAAIADFSPSHFHKIFTATMGTTPNEFIIKLRLAKAKELLVKTGLPVSEIAIQCGFENIPYFSYLFKQQLHISPAEFRKQHSYK